MQLISNGVAAGYSCECELKMRGNFFHIFLIKNKNKNLGLIWHQSWQVTKISVMDLSWDELVIGLHEVGQFVPIY